MHWLEPAEWQAALSTATRLSLAAQEEPFDAATVTDREALAAQIKQSLGQAFRHAAELRDVVTDNREAAAFIFVYGVS